MKKIILKAMASTAIPAAALLSGGTAIAQDEAPAANNNKTIIVTARKIEESLQDIPGAITAFNAEQMQRRSISELEDVALQTPGLVFEDFSNGGFGTPTIRGATQFAITSLEQNVSVFLDGVYIPRQYAFDLGSMNLERIEVVKGPQSALYGANAFAGAINYISTNRSLTETSASAELEVSQNGGFDISGKISAPLYPDILSVRLGLGHSRFGGDWENGHPNADADISPGSKGKLGGYEKTNVQVGLSFKPVDAVKIDFDYYHFDTSSETRAQFRITRTNGDTNCSPAVVFGQAVNQLFCGQLPLGPVTGEGIIIDPRSYGLESDTSVIRGHVSVNLTDQVTADYQFGRVEGDVFSAGGVDRDAIGGTFFGGQNINIFSLLPVGNFKYDSHELRLQYQSDSGFYAMVGGFYQDGSDLENGGNAFVELGGLTPITQANSGLAPSTNFQDTTAKAIFGRIAVPLMDERLTFEIEARYTDEKKTLPTLPDYTDKYFTPRASIDYKVTDDNLIYVSAAKGVKSGGINTFNLDILEPEEVFYGPDTNWTYEIGTKNVFMDGRVTLNAALFYIDWSNLQLTTQPINGTPNTRGITTNIGGASSKGAELEVVAEIVEGIELNAGIAYIDATYDEGTTAQRVTRANLCNLGTECAEDGDIGGNELQRTSKVQWNIGASAEAPISDAIDFFGRVDVAGQSKQFVSEVNVTTIQPRTLVNGRLGVRGDNWSASIWAKNLFDQKYVSNAFFIALPFGVDYVPTLGNRRRVGATLTFDY